MEYCINTSTFLCVLTKTSCYVNCQKMFMTRALDSSLKNHNVVSFKCLVEKFCPFNCFVSPSPQGSGTPKPSTPTNTPCSTPHPADSLSAPLSVTPTPSDPPMVQSQSQPALLTPFAQQQLALSQPLPVMTIPLPTMGTSITTGTTSSQVMANPAGLNFINVVSSVW